MSRHESVSCDSCLKNNFRGKRYKCIICYDYDLCATCYEAGATSSRHTLDHPMQCILTRADFDIYYGGEAITAEQPQSFTCPYCGKMGYTEMSLQEHVTTEHAESTAEVVCPICAALPGGDPNHVTDEFAAHLTLEHRAPRDFDEPMSGIRHVRRIPHPTRGGGSGGGGGSSGGSSRARGRTNMQFHSNATAAALSGLPVGSRESMDPIAELLSQLSSVRSRAAAQSVSSQLQQLEMQLQSTRYGPSSGQQLERLPRRAGGVQDGGSSKAGAGQSGSAQRDASAAAAAAQAAAQAAAMLDLVNTAATGRGGHRAGSAGASSVAADSPYLLSRMSEPETGDWERQAEAAADRSMFVQELLLSSLCEGLRLSEDDSDDSTEQEAMYAEEQSVAPSSQPPSVPAPAPTAATAVVVVDNTSHNCNTTSSSPPTATNNSRQRNKVREPPPPPSTAPLSSSPSSKLLKQ